MDGYYTFSKNGVYSFTDSNSLDVSKGSYILDKDTIKATNSKGEDLNYKIISITDNSLVMELSTIFFGQETSIKISCNLK